MAWALGHDSFFTTATRLNCTSDITQFKERRYHTAVYHDTIDKVDEEFVAGKDIRFLTFKSALKENYNSVLSSGPPRAASLFLHGVAFELSDIS